jgi:excisionase family DNA binding protein
MSGSLPSATPQNWRVAQKDFGLDDRDVGTGTSVTAHELVDGAELAHRLGVARTTIWRMARAHCIPYYAVGRRWRYCEAEVVRALRIPALAEAPSKRLPPPSNDTLKLLA